MTTLYACKHAMDTILMEAKTMVIDCPRNLSSSLRHARFRNLPREETKSALPDLRESQGGDSGTDSSGMLDVQKAYFPVQSVGHDFFNFFFIAGHPPKQ